jgi:AraC family transcriptional regulator of adaptative response/methylated-DNA-[protein]-cysteine methyltransferase
MGPFHEDITAFFRNELSDRKITLHLRGTGFQLKVWHALLKIPEGRLTNYGGIAEAIGQRSASRAVGSAIGSNQVAFLIPCHRVIRNSAVIGDFRWGTHRKKAMIGWEAARSSSFINDCLGGSGN